MTMTTPATSLNSALQGATTENSMASTQDMPDYPQPQATLSAEEKVKVLAWVNTNLTKCKSARILQERQWYLNLAFYMGKQNVSFMQNLGLNNSGINNQLVTPKAPYWRARPVVNKIRPIIRKELAKVTSGQPSAYVVPASSEDQDLFAAQAAEQLWESIYDSHKIPRTVRSAMYWTLITGVGYVKCYWDDTAEDEFNDQMGEICIKHENPWNIFVPDLTEEDIENQAYVINVTVKDIEWAQDAYGDQLDKELIATSTAATVLDSGFLRLINAQTQATADVVEIIECWIKPNRTKLFPEGGLVTIVGGQVAQSWMGWPYKHKLFPFIKLDHISTGGYYSESVITDLVPLQRELNRTNGQIIEAKNRMAKPQLIAPRGSINPAQITTEPGQVILYKPGYAPPQPLPLQPLPNYVLEELDRIQGYMEDISSQHEVSSGNAPPGVTAATAINFLQEQDDTVLAGTVESLEFGVQKMATMVLSYIEQYWTTERMVKTVGTDGSFDVIMLKGADLSGNTDIRIEKDSALPQSRAARQAFVMDLMSQGFIDPNKGLEVMEIGGIAKIYEAVHVDVRQAQRENLRMQTVPEQTTAEYVDAQSNYNQAIKMGIPPVDATAPPNPMTGQPEMLPPPPPPIPVNTWDNHQAHIEIHNKFRKSQTFEALPEGIKAVFEGHVQLHVMAMAPPPGAMPMPGQMPQDPSMMPPNGAPDMAGGMPPGGPQLPPGA